MTSFGNKLRRYLATTASKPCFALSVIQLVVRAYIFYVLGIDVISNQMNDVKRKTRFTGSGFQVSSYVVKWRHISKNKNV